MSSVVEGIVRRLREKHGRMQRSDWESYMRRAGVVVKYRDFGDVPVVGVVRGNTIFLHRGLSKEETVKTACHEFGHFSTHDGDIRWWETRPQGHITAAKMERQARIFSETIIEDDW